MGLTCSASLVASVVMIALAVTVMRMVRVMMMLMLMIMMMAVVKMLMLLISMILVHMMIMMVLMLILLCILLSVHVQDGDDDNYGDTMITTMAFVSEPPPITDAQLKQQRTNATVFTTFSKKETHRKNMKKNGTTFVTNTTQNWKF